MWRTRPKKWLRSKLNFGKTKMNLFWKHTRKMWRKDLKKWLSSKHNFGKTTMNFRKKQCRVLCMMPIHNLGYQVLKFMQHWWSNRILKTITHIRHEVQHLKNGMILKDMTLKNKNKFCKKPLWSIWCSSFILAIKH